MCDVQNTFLGDEIVNSFLLENMIVNSLFASKYSLQNAYDVVQLTKIAKVHQGIYSIARWLNLVKQSNNANYMNQESLSQRSFNPQKVSM